MIAPLTTPLLASGFWLLASSPISGTDLLPWVTALGVAGTLLFATLSYALRLMSRVKLEERLSRRHKLHVLEQIHEARDDLVFSASAIRLGFNVITIVSLAYYLHDDYADHPIRTYALAVIISVPLLLITSVALPKAVAKYAGEPLIVFSWPLLRLANRLLFPVVALMNLLDEIVRRLAGATIADNEDTLAEHVQHEILAAINEGEAGGTVDEEQKKMIEGVISLPDLQVAQIMTPRTDIIAVEVNSPIVDVRDKILKEGLSRVPVYEGTLDNIVGVLYAKDLLKFLDTRNAQGTILDTSTPQTATRIELRPLMRPPVFVPATKPIRDLLREMKSQQVHLAIVLDEYGGTAGLVTTEDIVEEIVGDIADEYERPTSPELRKLSDLVVEVDARISLAELNRQLNLALPEDQDYHTLAGFVIATLGAIPIKGETITHSHTTITVLDSEPRRIKRLRLDLPNPETPQPQSAEPAPHAA